MTISAGDTFLYPLESRSQAHLHVVVTPPQAGEVVIVSITTKRPKSEP